MYINITLLLYKINICQWRIQGGGGKNEDIFL